MHGKIHFFWVFLAVLSNLYHERGVCMYKVEERQMSLNDFNQPVGLHMDPNNRWIRMADSIPWYKYEVEYAKIFRHMRGNLAKPFRMAMGSLIIQMKFGYSDRELIQQITENPYYQYFIGLSGYEYKAPYDSSTLVIFRKRITPRMIAVINEYLITDAETKEKTAASKKNNTNNKNHGGGSGSIATDSEISKTQSETGKEPDNEGTLTIDATCAPQHIRYPQDYSLLNEARVKLENIIIRYCKSYGLVCPRMYRREARKNYLALAKTKKRTHAKIRKTIRKQSGYVKRDLGYLEGFMSEGYALTNREIKQYLTISKLFSQQLYMYQNNTHVVEDRIVSIEQPYIRPIVRGKVNAPVEFGTKLDISLTDSGYARIEKMSYDAYNESTCLITAIERYKERTGHYPKRVLADQIYRNRENIRFCKDHGIRLSGPKLGRPSKTADTEKITEYQDGVDRIEVERAFSLAKRNYGLGCITTKLENTTATAIALAIFTMNLFRASARSFLCFFYYYLGLTNSYNVKAQNKGAVIGC